MPDAPNVNHFPPQSPTVTQMGSRFIDAGAETGAASTVGRLPRRGCHTLTVSETVAPRQPSAWAASRSIDRPALSYDRTPEGGRGATVSQTVSM
jgi:hypothetical protein